MKSLHELFTTAGRPWVKAKQIRILDLQPQASYYMFGTPMESLFSRFYLPLESWVEGEIHWDDLLEEVSKWLVNWL